MQNPVKLIYKFNKEAGLLDDGYSDSRECAYPIEEALEGFTTDELNETLDINEKDLSPKELSRKIIEYTSAYSENISDVDRFDKHLDILVFSFGSLFKLGLSPQDVMHGLTIVAERNLKKLSAGKDSYGKQLKPKDFISPEADLNIILMKAKKRK